MKEQRSKILHFSKYVHEIDIEELFIKENLLYN